jgi:hypothetical protein
VIYDIDHIAIKVGSIDRFSKAFGELEYPVESVRQHDEVGMKIAFLGGGSSKLELLEVLDPSSPAAGSPLGLHHVGMKVKDIQTVYRNMSESDDFVVDGPIRKGAHSRIFFFRISGDEETLFECVESGEKA